MKVDSTLDNNSWDTIGAISSSGKASQYWSVGDTKSVVLNGTIIVDPNYSTFVQVNSVKIKAFIVHIFSDRCFFMIGQKMSNNLDLALVGYDYSTTGGQGFQMNNNATNIGGWNASVMRNYVLGNNSGNYSNLRTCMPAELQRNLRDMPLYTDNIGGNSYSSSSVYEKVDSISLPSEYEIFKTTGQSNPQEAKYQTYFKYFASGNSKKSYKIYLLSGNTDDACDWWLRSPYCSKAEEYFACADSGGSIAIHATSQRTKGIRPIFAI